MTAEYGNKIGTALRAIRQMHSDTSRLLQDCDGTIGRHRPSVFGSNATRDLTYQFNAAQWMAEGVYRYYDAADVEAGLVEGITTAFIDKVKPERPEEPLLIVGQIKYKVEDGKAIAETCLGWDLWNVYFDGLPAAKTGTILFTKGWQTGRVDWVKLIAVPLYSVSSMAVVEELMAKVRAFAADGER